MKIKIKNKRHWENLYYQDDIRLYLDEPYSYPCFACGLPRKWNPNDSKAGWYLSVSPEDYVYEKDFKNKTKKKAK